MAVSSSVRLHQVLLAASLVVPALLFTAVAWQNHDDVMREGLNVVQRTSLVMQEHARNVFETAELAIGEVSERIEEESRAEIASPGTSAFLHRIKAPMDQIVSLWIADADGTVLAGSQSWQPGGSIAPRQFFQIQKEADHGTYVGAGFTGVATAAPSFPIVRRRPSPDGSFAGTIHAAVSPSYFVRFYAEASPPMEHIAMLMRTDGAVLARQPEDAQIRQIGADTVLMRRLARGEDGMLSDNGADGDRREYAVRRVGNYPVVVVFAVRRSVLLERWYRNLRDYGAVAGAAALILVATAGLALRSAIAEQSALIRLREEARQRIATEQQLRHAQRLDAVGQLTGGVAHDFNNLLTAVMGNLELIQRVAGQPDGSVRIPRLAATAVKAVQRGAALTKSLLAFSRRQPMQARPVDVNATVEDAMELVRQALGVGIPVTFEGAPRLPACLADPTELEAALLNLAINARDANGGHVRITTALRTLGVGSLAGNAEARPGRFVSVAVADAGEGMAPEVAEKAFEPFFTTKPIGSGTGLGLSQVFGFVRQLGGHVTIDSSPGRGTVVTLFLPVAPEALAAIPATS